MRRFLQAFERGPGEEEALFAGFAEADEGFGLVAFAFDADDHALAELVVGDVVADLEAQLLRTGRTGLRAAARATAHDAGAQLAFPGSPSARVGAAGQPDQLLGDLGQEPAGRVVLGRPEQVPAPGVAEVEPLPGPGDA